MVCCLHVLDDNAIRELGFNRETKHGAYMKQICRDKGGIIISLSDILDYSTSPPMWRPKITGKYCGEFTNTIIIDDVHTR